MLAISVGRVDLDLDILLPLAVFDFTYLSAVRRCPIFSN
jgi:hypothetical protein